MSWKDTLYEIYRGEDGDNLDEMARSSTEAKRDDVGFINSVTGTGILARENGNLEGFADYGLGFRLDRTSQSLNLFASHIRLFCLDFQVHQGTEGYEYATGEFADVIRILHPEEGGEESETQL